MDLGAGGGAGDGDLSLPRRTALAADHAVGGNGKLQSHLRAALRLAHEIGSQRAAALLLQHTAVNRDAGRAKDGKATDARVRIGEGNDDAGNACRDDGIGAGRRPAVMGTGFERDVEGRPPRLLAGLRQRLGFAVGTAAGRGDGATDDGSVPDHDGADGGIGGGEPGVPTRQAHGGRHVAPVLGRHAHRAYGSSPGSRAILALISSITFSKSSACEKSR